MVYKESEYITEQYSEMEVIELLAIICNDGYLDAHRERCLQELKKRKII